MKAYISLQPADAPATYILAAATADPANGGCSGAQPLSGVAPFQLTPPPPINAIKIVGFHWPAALGPGAYWLCALPQDGNGQTAYAAQTFTVTAGTPASPQVVVAPLAAQTSSNLEPNGQMTVTVSDWNTVDDSRPHLYLLARGQPAENRVDLANATEPVTLDPVQMRYVYTVKLPYNVRVGTYVVVAEGECAASGCAVSAQSVPFDVTSPQSGRLGDGHNQAPSDDLLARLSSTPPLLLALAGVVALALAFFLIAPLFLRRRRRPANPRGGLAANEKQWRTGAQDQRPRQDTRAGEPRHYRGDRVPDRDRW